MQPYVVKNNESPGKNYGFDAQLADGIPSLAEYVAEYCGAAVSAACFLLFLLILIIQCLFFQVIDGYTRIYVGCSEVIS